jgi:DNA topoisomerase-2
MDSEIIENFLELVDIESVEYTGAYQNSTDISVDDDASFVLASGLVSHNSASSAFRKYRNPNYQGAFPLRGKFINVSEMPATKVIQNQEVKDLLAAIGLKLGEAPKDLRYGKVLIYSDADPDGDSIAGLLINFFGRYWPEMLEQGQICRVMTPLVVVKKGAETLSFYTAAEFEAWQQKQKDLKKWDISYKKGLAALEDGEYKDIIQNPKTFSIAGGGSLKPTLDAWFAGDPATRKQKILGLSENIVLAE